MVPLDGLWITANFKETQLEENARRPAREDQGGRLRREYTGKVLRIAGASGARFSLLPPENATGKLREGGAADPGSHRARSGPE